MSTENLHTIFHPFVLRVVFLNPDSTANNVWLTVSPCYIFQKHFSVSLSFSFLPFLFFFQQWRNISALFYYPRPQRTRAQLTDSRWTLAKRILTRHRVKAWVFTQCSRRSSILFRQASKHTAWRPANYPPAETCVPSMFIRSSSI